MRSAKDQKGMKRDKNGLQGIEGLAWSRNEVEGFGQKEEFSTSCSR